MEYVMAGSVGESVRRIKERSYRGGHSASERLVAEIYKRSTKNLLTALDFQESGIEVVRIYDNSEVGGNAKQVLSFRRGRPLWIEPEMPPSIEALFKETTFEIATLREALTPKPRKNDR
jgi:predicted ABC-type ATPase